MNNLDIRQAIAKRRLKYFEVAKALGITQTYFSHLMQNELKECEGKWNKKMILEVIQSIE